MQVIVEAHTGGHASKCMVVDQQCRESNRKVRIDGYMAVQNEQGSSPLVSDPKQKTNKFHLASA